jgi:type IV conjugative transfer system protein TraE
MRVTQYLERLDQATWLARTLQLLTLLLAVAVLILARQRTIVHVVPAAMQHDYRVGPTSASKEYLTQMATFLTTSALTVNRDNAEFAARAFLQQLSPEARGRIETTLLAEAQYIKERSITQAFYPTTVDFFSPTRLRVTGTLVHWLGGKIVTNRNMSYTLGLEVRNYATIVTEFSAAEASASQEESGVPGGPAPAAPAADRR